MQNIIFLGRDFSKPIAICVAEIRDVFDWGRVTVPVQLLNRLLPGPVTLCFNKFPELNPEFNPGFYHSSNRISFILVFIQIQIFFVFVKDHHYLLIICIACNFIQKTFFLCRCSVSRNPHSWSSVHSRSLPASPAASSADLGQRQFCRINPRGQRVRGSLPKIGGSFWWRKARRYAGSKTRYSIISSDPQNSTISTSF